MVSQRPPLKASRSFISRQESCSIPDPFIFTALSSLFLPDFVAVVCLLHLFVTCLLLSSLPLCGTPWMLVGTQVGDEGST